MIKNHDTNPPLAPLDRDWHPPSILRQNRQAIQPSQSLPTGVDLRLSWLTRKSKLPPKNEADTKQCDVSTDRRVELILRKDVIMAKAPKKKKDSLEVEKAPRAIRPINPFMAGFGLAAGWSAFHVPDLLSPTVIAMFAAKAIAIAIVAGGALAVLIEIIFVVGSMASRKIRSLLPMLG